MTESARSNLFTAISNIIDNMDTSELRSLVNAYNDQTSEGCHIYEVDYDFNDEFDDALEAVRAVEDGSFHSYDTYFTNDGELYSFDDFTLSDVDINQRDIVNYIIDDDDSLENDDIREALDNVVEGKQIVIHRFGGDVNTLSIEDFENEVYYGETYFKDENSNLVETAKYWLEMAKMASEDEEIEIREVTLRDVALMTEYNTLTTIVGYEGVAFGDSESYEDGRHILWFLADNGKIVLKLVYGFNPVGASSEDICTPRYIIEVKDVRGLNLLNIIKDYIEEV